MTDRELLEQLVKSVAEINQRFEGVDKRFDGIDKRFDKIEARLDNVEKEVTGIKLHLENVTDRNIEILAENYSHLIDKLNENNKITEKQELYQIKVNRLVEDMVIVKKDIADLKSARA